MKHDHRTHVIWHMTISQNGNVTGGEGKPLCMDSRVEEYHPEEVKKTRRHPLDVLQEELT